MIQAVALDRDSSALTVLDAYCQRANGILLSRTFKESQQTRLYLQQNRVDLVFLEPYWPNDSGINFWQIMQHWAAETKTPLPSLVFATAHSQYAQLSYELQALDYLLKPFSYERFAQTLHKVNNLLTQPTSVSGKPASYRSFRVDYGLVNVNLMDIACVEASGNYCKLYVAHQRPLVVRTTIKALLSELAPFDFIQVHRSYLVAVHRISAIRNKQIYLAEKQVPLSPNYERKVYSQLETLAYSSQQ